MVTYVSLLSEITMEALGLYLVYLFWVSYRKTRDKNLLYLAVGFSTFFVADIVFSLILGEIMGISLPGGIEWHEIFIIAILVILIMVLRRAANWRVRLKSSSPKASDDRAA